MNYLQSKAKWFATYWHESINQKRKYTNEPYINHPASVVRILRGYTDNTEMICAAWMHDLVEDTPCTLEFIAKEFGYSVAKLVEELTNKSGLSDGNRAIRKEIDRMYISMASRAAKTIKLADLIDNTSTIVEYDPEFAKVYLSEKELLLDVMTDGDKELLSFARKTLSDAKNKLGMT